MKINFSQIKRNKGAALLLTLLILTTIMVIVFSVSGLMYGELKLSQDVPQSLKAYYAADSAIERSLYDDRHGAGINDIAKCSVDLDNGSSYGLEYTAGNPAELKAWGCYSDVSRAIEVTY